MPGYLLHNLTLFGRLLRGLGLDVSPEGMIDLIQALEHINIGQKTDFYYAARTLLVCRREDLPLFDQAFQAFWHKQGGAGPAKVPGLPENGRLRPAQGDSPPLRQALEPGSGRDPADELAPGVHADRTYHDREVLRRKDFSALSGEELARIKRLISSLTWQLGKRRTRRLQPGSGVQVDLRRTLRHNIKYGGEILSWSRLEPKLRPRPVVVIADISGSMERYSQLLLHFIYNLGEGLQQRVEAFVFSTRLTCISRPLRGREVDAALADVGRRVPDWAGGTRIGDALKEFNFVWSRRVLGQGAVVLLISDGWDRGDSHLLQVEIARLQRSCYRLVWLNPLLGSENYEPLTRGMQAALPFIDDFLPVHNLASLEELARRLQELDRGRRARRAVQPSGMSPAAAI